MKKITGYLTTRQMLRMGLYGYQMQELVAQQGLIKVKNGLYRSPELSLQNQDFVDICSAMPGSVITGFSALAYYGLTTTPAPKSITVSIPKGKAPAKLKLLTISPVRQDMEKFKQNVVKVKQGDYTFKIYDMEKVICDAFKKRNKVSANTQKEILREYLKRKEKNMDKLHETALKCHVSDTLADMLNAIK